MPFPPSRLLNQVRVYQRFLPFFGFFFLDPPPVEEGTLLLLRLEPLSRRAGVVGRRGFGGRPYGVVPPSPCGSGSGDCSG